MVTKRNVLVSGQRSSRFWHSGVWCTYCQMIVEKWYRHT